MAAKRQLFCSVASAIVWLLFKKKKIACSIVIISISFCKRIYLDSLLRYQLFYKNYIQKKKMWKITPLFAYQIRENCMHEFSEIQRCRN